MFFIRKSMFLSSMICRTQTKPRSDVGGCDENIIEYNNIDVNE